jgi:hypothetical protein
LSQRHLSVKTVSSMATMKYGLKLKRRSHRVPRLYYFRDKVLAAPSPGLTLRLSSKEAILVTTKVSPNVGLARPLRLRVHELGHQAPIEQVVETALKLTLLHHGALKTASTWSRS